MWGYIAQSLFFERWIHKKLKNEIGNDVKVNKQRLTVLYRSIGTNSKLWKNK